MKSAQKSEDFGASARSSLLKGFGGFVQERTLVASRSD